MPHSERLILLACPHWPEHTHISNHNVRAKKWDGKRKGRKGMREWQRGKMPETDLVFSMVFQKALKNARTYLQGWRVLSKPCLEKAVEGRDSKKLFASRWDTPAFRSLASKLCSPRQELKPDGHLLCFPPSFYFLLRFLLFMLLLSCLRTVPQWSPGGFCTIEKVTLVSESIMLGKS